MYRLLLVGFCRTVNIRAMATTSNPKVGDKPIQLYSFATPNGQKIGIALEEFGLKYDAYLIDISKDVQFGKKKKIYM
jgi:hypothetical protein